MLLQMDDRTAKAQVVFELRIQMLRIPKYLRDAQAPLDQREADLSGRASSPLSRAVRLSA
jgi:hypothetical protein